MVKLKEETDLYKELLGVKKPTLNPGSGGWYGDGVKRPLPKKQVEDCLVLSAMELVRQGLLFRLKTDKLQGTITWNTYLPVEMRFESCPWYIRLQYRISDDEKGKQTSLDYTIPIRWQQKGRPEEGYVYFSPVFLCPGGKSSNCGKKASKLFLPSEENRFLCKDCHNLAYRAEQSSVAREARKFFKAVGLLK